MLARIANPDVEILFMQYGSPAWDDLEPREGDVFCDMSPPKDRAQQWVDVGSRCLDHHKHAADIVKMFGDKGIFADEAAHPGISGAVLMNMHLLTTVTSDTSWFANLIGTRDTWQKTNVFWDKACGLSFTLMHFPRDYWLLKPRPLLAVAEALELSYELGPILIKDRRDKAQRIVDSDLIHLREESGRKWGLYPERDALSSDVGEAARKAGFNATVAYFDTVEESRINTVFSLRSDETIDVGALCKSHGGGGHSRAADFSIYAAEHPALSVCKLLNLEPMK
jgi:hypothetical protein